MNTPIFCTFLSPQSEKTGAAFHGGSCFILQFRQSMRHMPYTTFNLYQILASHSTAIDLKHRNKIRLTKLAALFYQDRTSLSSTSSEPEA